MAEIGGGIGGPVCESSRNWLPSSRIEFQMPPASGGKSMSSNRLASIFAILSLGLASATFAATIDERVHAAYRHIDQGIRSGSINHHEAKRLREEFNQVRVDEARARKDGHLDRRERERLDREIDRLERHIYRAKTN
jgi:hypothetical protein